MISLQFQEKGHIMSNGGKNPFIFYARQNISKMIIKKGRADTPHCAKITQKVYKILYLILRGKRHQTDLILALFCPFCAFLKTFLVILAHYVHKMLFGMILIIFKLFCHFWVIFGPSVEFRETTAESIFVLYVNPFVSSIFERCKFFTL